jgi:hypothetical protein
MPALNSEYPNRPRLAPWVSYVCMVFGVANIISVTASLWSSTLDMTLAIGGFLVGGAWFAFGLYGGLPLVNTVHEWHRSANPHEVTDIQRRGLLVMRGRRWATWATVPGFLLLGSLLVPLLIRSGQPELVVLIIGVPLAIVNARYLLSRCPRCGYGFFARSTHRAAMLARTRTCRHCGLGLYAYKERPGAATRQDVAPNGQ